MSVSSSTQSAQMETSRLTAVHQVPPFPQTPTKLGWEVREQLQVHNSPQFEEWQRALDYRHIVTTYGGSTNAQGT